MNEKELLSAISQMMDERFQSVSQMMDERFQSVSQMMDERFQSMSQMMDEKLEPIKADISELKEKTTKIEITLENETNKNIRLLMEGHAGLVQKVNEIQKDTGRIEKIETELFATKEVTRNNVEKIQKLQTNRKI